jgi:hypothetical protein
MTLTGGRRSTAAMPVGEVIVCIMGGMQPGNVPHTRTKRIIVLANSIKKGARCVAGVTFDGAQERAAWLRPVSGESEGELKLWHRRTSDGRDVVPLDIVDVPLARYANDPIHPEDWVVDTARPWSRVGRFDSARLASLEECPPDLWLDPVERSDRATRTFLLSRPGHQSLHLVRPADLRIELSQEYHEAKGRDVKRTRARFVYRGQEYVMTITDPVFTLRHCTLHPPTGARPAVFRPPCKDRCLLCVSLTPEFRGFHYKVVATILNLP